MDAPPIVEGRRAWSIAPLRQQLEAVNKELWILLSVFAIAAVLNFAVTSQRMVLALYTLPSVFSAYCYGRRHATLTAVASALIVLSVLYASPSLVRNAAAAQGASGVWLDVGLWACVLVVTAYAMGTLYEHKSAQCEELRRTYYGLLELLRHFISNDKYTENHSYRVSLYAVRIASRIRMSAEAVEDVRAAALLHDIGKLKIGRELLHKAARLTEEEYTRMQGHVPLGVEMLESVGGSLRRVLPLVLAHHERHDGNGQNHLPGDEVPWGARVIKVADVYDSLTSDRPYRKAMPPLEARDHIISRAGSEFDPHVVRAFGEAFAAGELELPQIVV
ncbi:MAG: metal dependent phosphohydrolase [Acidobacteria bacterium]|nr:metal dependent phosphohydrolase [Acidobacteriota bacterium]